MALNWKGDQLVRKIRRAEKLAVDATLSAAVLEAKKNHGPGAHGLQRFESQTGELERSIRVTQPAKEEGRGVAGRFGSTGVVYAPRIELGFQGPDARGRVVNAPGFPFLRPAAEKEFPNLVRRLKRAFRREAKR